MYCVYFLYLVQAGFPKIEPVTCKNLIFCPKIQETNGKWWMHDAFMKKWVELLRSTPSDMLMKVWFTQRLSTCNFVRIKLNFNRLNHMFEVQNGCWISLLLNMQFDIPISSSSCSIQWLSISSVHAIFVQKKMVELHVNSYSNVDS